MNDLSQLSDEDLKAYYASLTQGGQPQAGTTPPQQAYEPGQSVFGGHEPVAGTNTTAYQDAARGAIKVDPNSEEGSVGNPVYDWQGSQAKPDQYHVTQGGEMQGPGIEPHTPISSLSDIDLQRLYHQQRWGQDALDTIPSGLREGFDGLAGAPGGAVNFLGQGMERGLNMLTGKGSAPVNTDYATSVLGLPGPGEMSRMDQQTLGKYYEPQSVAGQYTNTAAQFASGMVAPGGVAMRVARWLGPALASETAGQFTKGTPYEGAARTAGAVLGGGGVGLTDAAMASTPRLIGSAMGPADDAMIQRAEAIQQQARAQGVPITRAEAFAQAGGGRGLTRVQRVVEETPQGRARLEPMMTDRPQAVRGAFNALADQIAPPTQNPSMVGQAAQAEAEGGLDRIRQGVNAVARPYYDQLHMQHMDPTAYNQIVGDPNVGPSYRAALNDLRGNPELGAQVAHLPDNNLAVMNEVVKHLDTRADQAAGSTMNPGDLNLARIRGNSRGLSADLASDASDEAAWADQAPPAHDFNVDEPHFVLPRSGSAPPFYTSDPTFARFWAGGSLPEQVYLRRGAAVKISSNGIEVDPADTRSIADPMFQDNRPPQPVEGSGPWSQARQTEATLRGQWLDPLRAGPLGKIASSPDLDAQTSALYPAQPFQGAQNETAAAANQLPNTIGPLTRLHMERLFHEANQRNVPGDNPFGGAKFAATAAGNDLQRDTLMAGLRAVDPTLPIRTQALLDTFGATGKREAEGSKTAFNTDLNKKLNVSKAEQAADIIGNPLKWGEGLGDLFAAAQVRARKQAMADFLVGQDNTASLLQQARARAQQQGSGLTGLLGFPMVAGANRRP